MLSAKNVIERAKKDASFREQLQSDVDAAARNGVGSAAHRALAKHFVATEEELDQLIQSGGPTQYGFTMITLTTTNTTPDGPTIGTLTLPPPTVTLPTVTLPPPTNEDLEP